MRSFIIVLVLLAFMSQSQEEDFGAEFYDTKECSKKATTYSFYVIDALTKMGNLTGCIYQFNITADQCSMNTTAVPETSNNYTCINQSGPICPSPNGPIQGVATIICGDSNITEILKKEGSAKPGKEISLKGQYVELRVALGYVCNDTRTGEIISWAPRSCLTTVPSEVFTSFAYTLQTSLAIGLLILALLL